MGAIVINGIDIRKMTHADTKFLLAVQHKQVKCACIYESISLFIITNNSHTNTFDINSNFTIEIEISTDR